MKQILFAAALVLLVAGPGASTTGAYEDMSYEEYQVLGFPCGYIQRSNEAAQFGSYNWIQFTITTTGSLDICGQWFVTAAGSVAGVGGTSFSVTGVLYASLQREVPVPSYGRYSVEGVHTATTVIPLFRVRLHSQSDVDVVPPDEPDHSQPDCADTGTCLEDGQYSPIIIDMARNGYQLTSPADGVWFDLDADGVPERVSWTRQGGDDAFLAMDRNGNGKIDDGSELFGNHTPVALFASGATAANGFEALRFLEWNDVQAASTVQMNQILDAGDLAFGRLLIWHDANHNGMSEPEELTPLDQTAIAAIHAKYVETRRRDRFGNEFRQMGKLRWVDGSHTPVFDVWLRR